MSVSDKFTLTLNISSTLVIWNSLYSPCKIRKELNVNIKYTLKWRNFVSGLPTKYELLQIFAWTDDRSICQNKKQFSTILYRKSYTSVAIPHTFVWKSAWFILFYPKNWYAQIHASVIGICHNEWNIWSL